MTKNVMIVRVAVKPFHTIPVSPCSAWRAWGRRWMRASPTRVPTARETSSWSAVSW